MAKTSRRNTKPKGSKNHNSKMVQAPNKNAQTHKGCRNKQ